MNKFYVYFLSLLLTFTTAYAVHGKGASLSPAGGANTGKNPPTEKLPGSAGELPVARPIVPEMFGPLKAAEAARSQTVAIPTATGVYYAPKFRSFETLNTGSFEVARLDVLDPAAYEALHVSDSLLAERQHAFSIFEKVEENQRYVDILDQHTLLDLPVGIKKEVGGLQYTILIDSMVLTPTHAFLVAYMAFTTPEGKRFAFKGTNIRFSRNGGLQGDARLELLGDHSMNRGASTLLILKGDGGTFVEWDCYGFKNMGLAGEIEFSTELLVPDTESGEPGEGRVKAYFATEVSDWNNLMARVEIDPFQVPRLEGVGFSVTRAVFDFSSLRHVNGMRFPAGYENPLLAPGDSALWEGFYLQELSVRLPQQFEKEGGRPRTEFAAYNLLIDNMGFSGLLVGKNLITRDEGKMDTWAMSLDSLYINVVANQLQSGGLTGDVVVPVAENTPFAYTAIMNPGNEYIFNVSPADSLDFNLWKAGKVEIYPASYMEVSVEDGKFYPVMNLHGNMSIAPSVSEGGPKATLAGIEFQDLRISTRGRRISIGALSLGSGSDNKLAKFPFTVKDIGVLNEGDRLGLKVHMALNMMKSDKEGFSADGSFIAWGIVDTTAARERYRFDGLEVQELGIDVKKEGAYTLKGRVQFFRGDATYGNGFRGTIEAELAKFGVEAVAIFGNTGQYRYWYADALYVSNVGLPTGSGLSVYGIGGGAYHHMRQRASGEGAGSDYGKASSGIIYVPDEAYHLGLKATVQLGLDGKKEALNGDATFEVSMNRHGGINSIGFLGEVKVMTGDFAISADIVKAGASQMAAGQEVSSAGGEQAQVKGRMDLRYDFPNKIFHGEMNVFVNAAGGVLKGRGANGQAGWAVLHFAPDTWYVHVGSPDNPLGLNMMNLIETRSYFMMGDGLPGSPPPPDNVSAILGGRDLDYMRDLNALESGRGLAFGSHFEASTGEQRFLMFYGHFSAGAGLDIMVKDYGAGAICEGSSEPLGINGWYANGQAYAFVEGKIGIKVALAFYEGNYDILDIGAAAIMQAKGPNPFWMQGTVGGRYNILNGLVKGNCSFDVTIGEECNILTGSPLGDIQVIAEITPSDGEQEVNVFNAPQVVFNMPVDQEFEIGTESGTKTFIIQLDHFELLEGESPLAGDWEWNAAHDVLAFNSYDIFPSETALKARVQVSFKELKHGSWQTVSVRGQQVTESLEVEFTTGIAPDYIPLENVAYSYPLIRQYNFYPNEARTGYIKLKQGQPDLFGIGGEWEQKGRFKNQQGDTKLFDYSYDAGARQINFTIPEGLTNNAIYTFELVNIPAGAGPAIDSNVDSLVNQVALADAGEGTDMSIRTNEAEGTIDLLQEKEVFGTHFRTSHHNTFVAKFNALSKSSGWIRVLDVGVHELGSTYTGQETFDKVEAVGNAYTSNLMQFEAVLNDRPWYTDEVYPLIYQRYPLAADLQITYRSADSLGVPPVRAVRTRQYPKMIVLKEEEISSNQPEGTPVEGAFIYNLPYYIDKDLYHLQNKAANKYAGVSPLPASIATLLQGTFPVIKAGVYRVKVKYVLPGQQQPSSETEIGINNPFYEN